MTRQETIKYLGLDNKTPSEETSTKSVYELTQDEYARSFTLLDRNESDWNEDSGTIDNSDEDKIESLYYTNGGNLYLVADLGKDTYKIIIEDEDLSND